MSLDDDVATAIEHERAERNVGISEVVNRLLRLGLVADNARRRHREPFRQRTVDLGLRIDVSNVAEALEQLDRLDAAENDQDSDRDR